LKTCNRPNGFSLHARSCWRAVVRSCVRRRPSVAIKPCDCGSLQCGRAVRFYIHSFTDTALLCRPFLAPRRWNHNFDCRDYTFSTPMCNLPLWIEKIAEADAVSPELPRRCRRCRRYPGQALRRVPATYCRSKMTSLRDRKWIHFHNFNE